ncbi:MULTISPECIES: hypothetical protein [unclassified Bartonella]|uniref:hypothetical protein n=1 Tax=unclassified Bartonella TaxID=2645622 RepID=UPI0035CE9552
MAHPIEYKIRKNLGIGFQEDIVDCDDNDAVKQRIGLINGYLKSVVKEGWVDITEGKSLFDDCIIEKSNSGFVDYCLQIKANNLFFYLHERSKGVSWFFCFKVLTEVRRHRSKNGIIFLLDESANNLHIHPQRKILSSLQTLSSIKGNKVIYSKHSPYLINDDNLDNLFTVRNEANDFEAPRIVCERFLELTTSSEETVRAVEPIVQKTWITHLGTGADWIIKKFNGVAANAKKVNHIADCVKHIIGG